MNSDWSWTALRFGVYLFMKDRIGVVSSSISGHEVRRSYSESFHGPLRLHGTRHLSYTHTHIYIYICLVLSLDKGGVENADALPAKGGGADGPGRFREKGWTSGG